MEQYQGYVEPKGDNLLEADKWKEDFMLSIPLESRTSILHSDAFSIFGLPFFNQRNKLAEFEMGIDLFLQKL